MISIKRMIWYLIVAFFMSAVGNVIVGSFIGSEYSLTDINFYRSLNFLITAFALWGIMIMLSPDKSTVPGLKV